jgi:hypothetical protein
MVAPTSPNIKTIPARHRLLQPLGYDTAFRAVQIQCYACANEMSQELKLGAVLLIDALGIRGIWDVAENQTAALATLKAALETARGMKRYIDNALLRRVVSANGVKVHVMSLSDSIVVAAVDESNESTYTETETNALLLDLVCQCGAYVMREAAKKEPPIVYRGVVTVGRLVVDETFLLGPAIDEAAGLVDVAQGAFVWFAPSANAVGRPSYGGPNVWSTMVFEYAVPMKDGTTCATRALSPFVDQGSGSDEPLSIRAGFERAMQSRRADVSTKRNNTLQFLDTLLERSKKKEGR